MPMVVHRYGMGMEIQFPNRRMHSSPLPHCFLIEGLLPDFQFEGNQGQNDWNL